MRINTFVSFLEKIEEGYEGEAIQRIYHNPETNVVIVVISNGDVWEYMEREGMYTVNVSFA